MSQPSLHQINWPETAVEVLACRPMYFGGMHLSTRTHWTDKEKAALRLMAEAGAGISDAAVILGRSEKSIAWRCRDERIAMPSEWVALIGKPRVRKPRVRKPRMIKPRAPKWTPLAYPYINFRRTENETLLLVNEMVSRALPGREDVCQDIMLAILERGLKPDRATVGEFIRKFRRENYESNGYALSLDAPMPGMDNFALIDTLSEDDSLWAKI